MERLGLDFAFGRELSAKTEQGGGMRIFRRTKESFEVARGVVNGKEITYSFTKPLGAERAQREFKEAVEKGLPSGSVIIIP